MTSPAARRIRPAVPHGMTSWLLLAAALFSLNAWALLSSFERMAVSLSILVFYLFPFLVGLLAVVWSGPLGSDSFRWPI